MGVEIDMNYIDTYKEFNIIYIMGYKVLGWKGAISAG